MPSAANVPMTVASREDSSANKSVFLSAVNAVESRKSSRYHLTEKPVKLPRFPDSLNENMKSTRIGAYKSSITANIYMLEKIGLFFLNNDLTPVIIRKSVHNGKRYKNEYHHYKRYRSTCVVCQLVLELSFNRITYQVKCAAAELL